VSEQLYSRVEVMLSRQDFKLRTAVFSDIEDSLAKLGYEETTEKIVKWARNKAVPLVAVTGLRFNIVKQRMENEHRYPWFDLMSTDGGVELYVRVDEGKRSRYLRDAGYHGYVMSRVEWDRERLMEQGRQVIKRLETELPSARFDFHGSDKRMAEQGLGGDDLREFVVGFRFFAQDPRERNQIVERLNKLFGEEHDFVCTEEINFNRRLKPGKPLKYCYDRTLQTKEGLVEYVSKKLKIEAGLSVGDGGNDAGQIMETAHLVGVVVGGAKEELRYLIDEVTVRQEGEIRWIERESFCKQVYVEPGGGIGPETILKALALVGR
jgi:hydroxymethylpyrimidine pyrophosphatase-like HAD family hydrolase